MSFASSVKEDLVRAKNKNSNIDLIEAKAMLKFSGEVMLGLEPKLSFTNSSMAIIRRLIKILKDSYKFEYEIESRIINRLNNSKTLTLRINSGAKSIITDLGLIFGSDPELNSDEEKIAYLRGAFLVTGSVNDPKAKNSHLEISLSSDDEILFVQKLINDFELNARIAKRKNKLIVYLKSRSAIGDFLYLLGATSSMEYYEDAIIIKDIETTAKRTINLDVANQSKTNSAAQEQLKAIEYLEFHYPLEQMDSKLLMVMKVRKENKESSLSELLEIIHTDYDPKLTKSGLNHRMKKLIEMANELKLANK